MTNIELFDTTLRDGTQGEHVTLSVTDKARIAHRLDAFGIGIIEGGWPGSNPKDQEFFELVKKENWQQASICAFGSTRHPRNAPDQDPNLRAMVGGGNRYGVHIWEKLAFARSACTQCIAGRKPGHDFRISGMVNIT